FVAREISHPRNISEETARMIDIEVRKIITGSMEQAEQLLRDNSELLHLTSKILLEREVIDGEELDKLIRGETLPPVDHTRNNFGTPSGTTDRPPHTNGQIGKV